MARAELWDNEEMESLAVDHIIDPLPDLPKAILFDMDGTLTEPMLDFPKIKAEMGIGDRPILESLAQMNGSLKSEAEAVLLRHETQAAENSVLNPGCHELLQWLAEQQIQRALITRNSRASVQTVLGRHGLAMDVLVTREEPPYKPDPHPLRLACKKLAVADSQVWMVGDGWYDIEAGNAAHIKTVWISHGKPRPFATVPWRQVRDLPELQRLLVEVAAASRPGANSRHRGRAPA
jgi:HAD superfamily hydrolase (TIGR01549 family)